jgi:hypothetical protein
LNKNIGCCTAMQHVKATSHYEIACCNAFQLGKSAEGVKDANINLQKNLFICI